MKTSQRTEAREKTRLSEPCPRVHQGSHAHWREKKQDIISVIWLPAIWIPGLSITIHSSSPLYGTSGTTDKDNASSFIALSSVRLSISCLIRPDMVYFHNPYRLRVRLLPGLRLMQSPTSSVWDGQYNGQKQITGEWYHGRYLYVCLSSKLNISFEQFFEIL